jgi:hypothetical protein
MELANGITIENQRRHKHAHSRNLFVLDKLAIHRATFADVDLIEFLRKDHHSRYNLPMGPIKADHFVMARMGLGTYACCGWVEADDGIVITDLYAMDNRVGKAAAGAILRWMHDFADSQGKAMSGVTAHPFIVEHALARGWQVAGMVVVRPVGGA